MFTIMNDSSSMRLTTVPPGSYDQDRGRRARRQRLDPGGPVRQLRRDDGQRGGHGHGRERRARGRLAGGDRPRQRAAGREPGAAAGGHVRGAAQPLALVGAMTQGMLGSLIARAIDLLRGRGTAAALVTHVTVDPADPAFGAPTKPIGPFFEPAEAERLARRGGWVVQPDSGRGYRRVVASPQPVGVVEIEAMRALVEAGHLVIAGGGGGIPVLAADPCQV